MTDTNQPNLNVLRDAVHQLARAKGWWDCADTEPRGIGAKLALIHSEVSEALECIREDRMTPKFEAKDNGKPAGLPSELADIIIRTLDLCGALGIDIDAAVRLKHGYNATRTHRHGGKSL